VERKKKQTDVGRRELERTALVVDYLPKKGPRGEGGRLHFLVQNKKNNGESGKEIGTEKGR